MKSMFPKNHEKATFDPIKRIHRPNKNLCIFILRQFALNLSQGQFHNRHLSSTWQGLNPETPLGQNLHLRNHRVQIGLNRLLVLFAFQKI